jgi:uncharacterized protein with HEPN domain
MPPETGDDAHLWDMLQYARAIAQEIEGESFARYEADENWRLAIERRIEIIGEAAARVSKQIRAAHPEIPWRPIISQRNVLAHAYGEIDDRRVWEVAVVHIPALIGLLEQVAPKPLDP